ncbi:MAG TPA: tetratricopeptide repeat protein [Bacteroidales bacterium]|nr:tetratricopeptide repeat protein [Bacteroidales bacterium]
MKPNFYRGFILIIVLMAAIHSSGQTSAMYKYVKIDTTKVIQDAQLVKIATRFYDRHYKQIYDAKEKMMVDQSFGKLEAPGADRYKLAQSLSSTAVMLTGTGQSVDIPIVFSAKAAILFPKDTLIVNNFGAILRMMDSVKTSLPVLLYAKSLFNGAPLILTNLGNTLFELYDDKGAEYYYKRSLKINPDFSLAKQGLVSVYLKRKDLGKALEMLFASVQGMYSESMKSVNEKVKYNPKYAPPSQSPVGDGSGGDDGGSAGNSAPNPDTPVDQLILPSFPNWSEMGALIADESIDRVKKKINQVAASDNSLTEAMKLLQAGPEAQQAWYEEQNKPGKILFDGQEFAMDLMEVYFQDQIDKAERKYNYTDSVNIAKFGQYIEQISANDEQRAAQMNTNVEAWQAFLVEKCEKFTNANKDLFGQWKQIAATRHAKYVDLLTTYWVYCEQYLNRTYNKSDFEKLNSKRKSFVAMNFGYLYTDYSIKQMQFGFSNLASLASVMGDCPTMPPPPPPPSNAAGENVNVPDKEGPECPFKDRKLKIGLIVCSVGLDCESIEGECGEGLLVGAKWNYKKKELTGFGGAGFKADLGVEGAVNIKAEGKAGFEVTFNTKNQLVDVAYKTEVTGTAGVGNTEVGQAVEFKIGAATGIDISRTTELTYNPLGF